MKIEIGGDNIEPAGYIRICKSAFYKGKTLIELGRYSYFSWKKDRPLSKRYNQRLGYHLNLAELEKLRYEIDSIIRGLR